jgi:hypothetical protein
MMHGEMNVKYTHSPLWALADTWPGMAGYAAYALMLDCILF